MAKPRGRPFKKGNQEGKKSKGGGRSPVDPEIVQMREINRNVITQLLTKYSNMTVQEMKEARNQPSTPVLDQIIISICIKAVQMGDSSRANWLVENMTGKLPNEIKVKTQTFHGQLLEKIDKIKDVDNDQ